MSEEMNQAEIAREETEQKMIYKFLLMVKAEKEKNGNLEELEKQVEAMIKQYLPYKIGRLATTYFNNLRDKKEKSE